MFNTIDSGEVTELGKRLVNASRDETLQTSTDATPNFAILPWVNVVKIEVFGVRTIILLKDVDGLYTADPKTHPEAKFIPEIGVAELIRMDLPTLPIEPVLLQLLTRAKLARSVRIINGQVAGNLTRALAGDRWAH